MKWLFKNVIPHTDNTPSHVFIPVKWVHIKIKYFLVLGVQLFPQVIHIIQIKVPFGAGEKTDQFHEFQHFLIDLYHPGMK
jgi:hypothetical protein